MFIQLFNAGNVGINVTTWKMQSWSLRGGPGINWTNDNKHSDLVWQETGMKRTKTLRNFGTDQAVYHKTCPSGRVREKLVFVREFLLVCCSLTFLYSVRSCWDSLLFLHMKRFLGKLLRMFILISTQYSPMAGFACISRCVISVLLYKLSILWITLSIN